MKSHGKTATAATSAKPVVAIVTSMKAFNVRVAALKVSAADLQQETHVLAVSALHHLAKNRNINVLTQFLDAIPDMVRVNALKQWFETFGEVTFSPAKDGDKPSWRFDADKKTRIGEAMEKPFYKFKALEGAPYKPLVMDTYVDNEIKRLEKDIKANPENADLRKAILAQFRKAKAGELVAH